MIHTYPGRLWYVTDFLIPSMRKQGIKNIEVWNDWQYAGNLLSFVASMMECGERDGGIWHLQDDIVISHDFALKTQEYDSGMVAGYCHSVFGPLISVSGKTKAPFLWNSFPCLRIPNEIAKEFAKWYLKDARKRKNYREWVQSDKHDDGFFHDFIDEAYPDMEVINLKPNIVDHIDYLLGGSTINADRTHESRAEFFEDHGEVRQLEIDLAKRR